MVGPGYFCALVMLASCSGMPRSAHARALLLSNELLRASIDDRGGKSFSGAVCNIACHR